jgi:hypothetical protein
MSSERRFCLTPAAEGIIVLTFALALIVIPGLVVTDASPASPAAAAIADTPATYVCPMHADVRRSSPGTCPRCGMTVIPIRPAATRQYQVVVETSPQPVAGRPIRLTLTVREPDTKGVVRDFAVVHEKRFHLFVLSQDLNHYDHVHPEQQPDGSFAIDVTLPRDSYYKLFADFLPDGGTPQVIAHTLVTEGFSGHLTSSMARLEPDDVLRKTIGNMSVQLSMPEGGLVAGRDEKFGYHLTDARTGQPVRDIEPYLGAWGHTLIMSEDTLHFVHAHPIELLPGQLGALGGPDLTFKAMLPKPGRYRIWTQIKRGGVVSTAVFTVSVPSPSTQ